MTGRSFLYKMVRVIAGAVATAGAPRSTLTAQVVATALASRQRPPPCKLQIAPAHGLTLHTVYYGGG